MKRLGYNRFAAQGGDWGALVTDVMAQQAPPELLGIHTNLPGTTILYWLTNTGISSARLYWENKFSILGAVDVSVPAAVSVFADEIDQAPRSWAERAYHNLIYCNQVNEGGHFAAWEQPDLFSGELRAAFRSLSAGAVERFHVSTGCANRWVHRMAALNG